MYCKIYYKRHTARPYSYLLIDDTPASDNLSRFREKEKTAVNRAAAKISALLSDKIDKYEYLIGEEILPSGPSWIIQKANSTYWSLENTF